MNNGTQKRNKKRSLPFFLLILLVLFYFAWALPLPKIKAESTYIYKSRPQAVNLAWPNYGQAAVGALGYGVLDSHGTQTPAPMASVTKVVTALAVLKQKPLAEGNQGPTIKISSQDLSAYNNYYAMGGSVVSVSDGEQISEYQALQAMLLPSANNMADTLARWAFGSMDAYTTFANNYLKSLGLKSTHLDDASGFSPKSVSTAQDLTSLGLIYMSNPVLRDISAQSTAEIPVAGTVHNTNWLLNTEGVVGIKTGNTDQAGGCFLFADNRTVEGQKLTVVGAIMSAPDLTTAISDSLPLMRSVDGGFENVVAARKNEIIGIYVSSWGEVVNIVAKKDLSLLTWKTRQAVTTTEVGKSRVAVKKGEPVGKLKVTAWDKSNTIDLVADSNIDKPNWQWRLYKRHI